MTDAQEHSSLPPTTHAAGAPASPAFAPEEFPAVCSTRVVSVLWTPPAWTHAGGGSPRLRRTGLFLVVLLLAGLVALGTYGLWELLRLTTFASTRPPAQRAVILLPRGSQGEPVKTTSLLPS